MLVPLITLGVLVIYLLVLNLFFLSYLQHFSLDGSLIPISNGEIKIKKNSNIYFQIKNVI